MAYPEWWKEWLQQNYHKVKDVEPLVLAEIKDTLLQTNLAVIIEPRKHELLKWVCWNFMNSLNTAPLSGSFPSSSSSLNSGSSPSSRWELCVVHGSENGEFVKSELNELEKYVTIHYYELPFSNMNEPMYNGLLTNKSFWETLPTDAEHLLIFQTDTILLKGDLTPFLDYDFVGAMWKDNHPHGANGGLSLRKRSAMIRVCSYMKFDPKIHGNEDGYFTLHAANMGLVRLPTTELGMEEGNRVKCRFSMETVYSKDCCGMHKPYDHLPSDLIKEVLKR